MKDKGEGNRIRQGEQCRPNTPDRKEGRKDCVERASDHKAIQRKYHPSQY